MMLDAVCRGAAVALLIAVAGLAHANNGPQVVTLQVCIDGLDNLHVKDGRLRWEHLAFDPPGRHAACKAVTWVDGARWEDWSTSFPLPIPASTAIAFHPVVCRGNCVLVQQAAAANGWEAIYQLDDYALGGPAVYCIEIVIGGPPEAATAQSVQHIRPAPSGAGGRPLFTGIGGALREGGCGKDFVS
jgi:hypothetical protein